MAKVTYTERLPDLLMHKVSHGSQIDRQFPTGLPVEVDGRIDVAHYMTSGGFKVEISKAEAAFYMLHKDEFHLSKMKDVDIAAMSSTSVKKIRELAKKIKVKRDKPVTAKKTDEEYYADVEAALEDDESDAEAALADDKVVGGA